VFKTKGPSTATETVAVPEHPLAVPTTVYVVFDVGLSVIGDPVCTPGFQLYVVPPAAVKVTEFPVQIAAKDALAVMTGIAVTVTVAVAIAEQLVGSVPTTV
jgi:hypothetical protein